MSWISVEDKLPEVYQEVLAYGRIYEWRFPDVKDSKIVCFALLESKEKNEWFYPTGNCYDEGGHTLIDVSHWMPLPEAPEEI